jgi:hypothetical protein
VAKPKRISSPKKKRKGKPRRIPALKLRPSSDPLPELGQVEDVLRDLIGRAEEPRQEGPGKRKELPALCLWAGLLVCVLRGFKSQTDLWRLLSIRGLWSFPRVRVTDEAVRKRLVQRGGAAALEKLFKHVSALLAVRLQPYAEDLLSFAVEVVAIDQTTLDAVMRHLPELRGTKNGDPKLLPGRLSGRFDLRRQQWQKIEFTEDAQQNEKVLARQMVEGLKRGSLILFDLGYFAFEFFDWLTDGGYYWVSRMREKTSYVIEHVHYQRGDTLDALVWLGAHRADRAKHLVRMVQFRHGEKVRRYITNVRDPKLLPLDQIARLYARRWDIEMAIKLVKRELNLSLLWSAKQEVMLQQIWAVLIISQIFQALRKEIAGKAGVDVFDVSMPLMIRMLPQFAADGLDPVEEFVKWGRVGKMIRPARRVKINVPRINPSRLQVPPEGLQMERTPRYARRKNGPRSN